MNTCNKTKEKCVDGRSLGNKHSNNTYHICSKEVQPMVPQTSEKNPIQRSPSTLTPSPMPKSAKDKDQWRSVDLKSEELIENRDMIWGNYPPPSLGQK